MPSSVRSLDARLGGRCLRLAALALALLAGAASASNPGDSRHAWTATVNGPALYGKGLRAVSPPIEPVGHLPQAEGVITAVRWRYRFTRVPPPDLQAYLCNASRCVLLPGAEGRTEAFRGDDAGKGFVFAYRVPGQGPLAPVLRAQSNEVTVSFR
jgi:flagellar protein FlhE